MRPEGSLASEIAARHPRGHLIAFGFGILVLCAILGIVRLSRERLIDIAAADSGTIRIEAVGRDAAGESPIADALNPATVDRIREVLGAEPDVLESAPQLRFESRLQRGGVLADASIVGIDPANRSPAAYTIIEGADLRPGDFPAVLIDETLASDLGVAPGDYIEILSPTPAPCGAKPTKSLRISGVYRDAGTSPNSQVAYLPLRMAQHVADTEGLSHFDVFLADVGRASAVAASLRSAMTVAHGDAVVRVGVPVWGAHQMALTRPLAAQWVTECGIVFLLLLLGMIEARGASPFPRGRSLNPFAGRRRGILSSV